MNNSQTLLFILCMVVFIAMIAVAFVMNAKSIVSQQDIDSCDDLICANSINKEIANEELDNQSHTTTTDMREHHHTVIKTPTNQLPP